MSTSGYSGTPLINKLGIKPSMKLLLVNNPAGYFDLLETDIRSQLCEPRDVPDFIHLFVIDNKEFEREMKKINPLIKKNREVIIWISWYKKSSKLGTDLTEDVIRNYALRNGLVDIKVCAVNDIWSGLKLVVPKKLR